MLPLPLVAVARVAIAIASDVLVVVAAFIQHFCLGLPLVRWFVHLLVIYIFFFLYKDILNLILKLRFSYF